MVESDLYAGSVFEKRSAQARLNSHKQEGHNLIEVVSPTNQCASPITFATQIKIRKKTKHTAQHWTRRLVFANAAKNAPATRPNQPPPETAGSPGTGRLPRSAPGSSRPRSGRPQTYAPRLGWTAPRRPSLDFRGDPCQPLINPKKYSIALIRVAPKF